MVRVLIHSHSYYPRVGGCESFTDFLATGLAGLGMHISVVTEQSLNGQAERKRPYRVHRSDKWQDEHLLGDAQLLISVGPSLRYLGIARKHNVPCILVDQGAVGEGAWWDSLRRKRVCQASLPGCRCLTYRSPCRPFGRKVVEWTRLQLLRWRMAQSVVNVFCSNYLSDRVRVARSQVIWNSFDNQLFRPADRMPEKFFAFVGRLVSDKGADVAVKGFARLLWRGYKVTLRILGSGPEELRLKELTSSLGITDQVDFYSLASPAQVAQTFGKCWAALVPSQWPEPFGIVVAEAMGSGCPVIASHHGGPPEIIGETGILVSPADPEAWADAMQFLLDDPARRHELGQAASERAHERFAVPVMVERYSQLIKSIVGG